MSGAFDDPDRWWDSVSESDELPELRLPITFARVIAIPAATWDYFPGHHDPEYARAQGQDTIYLSTMFLSGFVDRVVTDWAGSRAFVCARELNIGGSVYAGQVLTGRARVSVKRTDGRGVRILDVEVIAGTEVGTAVQATVSVTRNDELNRTDGLRR